MTYFVVTDRRVIYRTGVLSKRGVEIPLERINNINFHRVIDRIIGAGDRDIESAGQTVEPFRLRALPTACSTRSTARWKAQHAQNFVQVRRLAPRLPLQHLRRGVPEQIEQLAQLKAQGHITDAE